MVGCLPSRPCGRHRHLPDVGRSADLHRHWEAIEVEAELRADLGGGDREVALEIIDDLALLLLAGNEGELAKAFRKAWRDSQ